MILQYERRTHFPTYQGNGRFCVDDRGGVFVQVNRSEPPLDQEWSAGYPAAPVAQLRAPRATIEDVLRRHGFADLPARLEEDTDDGMWERLTYWDADGAAREVVVDRAQSPAFRALLSGLAAALGIADQLG